MAPIASRRRSPRGRGLAGRVLICVYEIEVAADSSRCAGHRTLAERECAQHRVVGKHVHGAGIPFDRW